MSEFTEQNLLPNNFTSESWVILTPIEQSIKSKIERIGKPLRDWDISINYGIKTGFNEAFIIDGKTKDELIRKSPKSADVIRPILRGRDIKRYKADFADLWLLNIHNGTDTTPPVEINDYPEIKAHLDQFYPALEARQDKGITPYNLRSCVYTDDFSKQKIVWGNLCLNAQYAIAEEGVFVNAPSTMIVPGDKYLLGILNSRVSDFYIRQLGVTRNGGYFEYKPMFVSQLPVPEPDIKTRDKLELIVNKLLANPDNIDLDNQLNSIICDLYQLTEEEISFIEQVL
jgi:hypothetical protein